MSCEAQHNLIGSKAKDYNEQRNIIKMFQTEIAIITIDYTSNFISHCYKQI